MWCEQRDKSVEQPRTFVTLADEQSTAHTGCTTVEDDAVLGAPWGVAPDGFDGAACCPVPGSGVNWGTIAPRGPYVPFLCHVADADFGAKDEPFVQGEEGRGFGRGGVVVDEICGRWGRGGGEEKDVVEDAALGVQERAVGRMATDAICEQAMEKVGRVAARDGEEGAVWDGGQAEHRGIT